MKSLNAGRFGQAEAARNVWVINPEYGTTPEDVLESHFLSHVSKFLRPYDKIEARSEDGSWYAEYRVIDAGIQWAKLKLTYKDELEAKVDLATVVVSNHEVAFKGPHYKWAVIRKGDNVMLKTGLASKAEAFKWLGNYEQVIEKPMELKATGLVKEEKK